ncbi:hypothetical protein EJB05_09389 [Eragrostis curvula]|uniref:Uncharacterized protein n=1 Tax=Eragrostis curvula TaxID=38414 RepID=A0A5J9W2L0_9POAL|nr:hypothetical protein EJB05_09389 [Eragrostis curvula]
MRKCTYIICAIAFTSHVHYDAPSAQVEETAESVVDEHWLGELQVTGKNGSFQDMPSKTRMIQF